MKASKIDVTLDKVHRFLADKVWPELEITGIIYDDLPHNVPAKARLYSEIKPLYYKKRIQIVVFNDDKYTTFAPHLKKRQ